MTPALVLLFLALAAAHNDKRQAAPAECAACTDDSCQVRDNVRVQSLCADSLCVNGDPVVVGDGDPCTTDDIVNGVPVHTPVKDCCRTDADCEQFVPEPCTLSQCMREGNATHGFCAHTRLAAPECCSVDCDCPDRPCFDKKCIPNTNTTALFAHMGSNHQLKLIRTDLQVVSAPGTCNYTRIESEEQCCTSRADCTECPPNMQPICELPGVCVCLPTATECLADADCQTDENENENCARKGRCFGNVCDRGWCACKQSLGVDADGDGVLCNDDCDDTNPAISATIFCPVGNRTDIDADNDGVAECGVFVKEVCNTTCANGMPPVNKTDLERSKRDWKKWFLAFNCDCCSNATGPDETIFCGQDQNENGVFALQDIESETPCAIPVCVPVANAAPASGGRGHSEPSRAERDAQCAAAFNDPSFVFVPKEERVGCDRCDGTPDEDDNGQPNVPVECPVFLSDGRPICDTGQDIDQCCNEILTTADGTPAGEIPAEFQPFINCCRANDTEGGAACEPGDEGYPLEQDVCDCTDATRDSECFPEPNDNKICDGKIEFQGEGVVIKCVFDRDGDKFFNCTDVEEVCIRLPTRVLSDNDDKPKKNRTRAPTAINDELREKVCREGDKNCPRGNHGGDDEDDDTKDEDFCRNPSALLDLDPNNADDEDLLCKIQFAGTKKRVAGFAKVRNGVSEDDIEEGERDGTFCDCNDNNEDAHQLIVCLRDQDGDGVPNCPGLFDETTVGNPFELNRKAECSQVCADKCGRGYINPNTFKTKSGEKICEPILTKKRSTFASLASLHQAAAKHEWFDKKNDKRHGDYDKKDDDEDDDDKSSGSSSTSSTSSSGSGSHGTHDDDDKSHGTKSHGSRTKPDEQVSPREDATCGDGYQCGLCDCCDTDCAVYEQNPISLKLGKPSFSSVDETNCGGWNYACNVFLLLPDPLSNATPQLVYSEPFVACPGVDAVSSDCDRSRRRTLFSVYNLQSPDLNDPVLNQNIYMARNNDVSPLDDPGSCDESQDCAVTRGWQVESPAGEDDKRKRAAGAGHGGDGSLVEKLCKATVSVRFSNVPAGNSTLVAKTGTKTRRLQFGDCADFIEACTEHPGPLDNSCTPDCEMCVRIGN